MEVPFLNCDPFHIIKTVGKGTYGTVYLCERNEDKKLTIVKEIYISPMDRGQYQDTDNEIHIISKLHHPNIIQYMDSYYYKNRVYISMEYAEKGNLAEYMFSKQHNLVPQKEVLFFFSQILLGVDYIHSKNIIHRDLKAENILLTGKRGVIVKIGDFGIARMLMNGQKAMTVIGTPYYLAPELCDNQPYDTKTDVWALGCLLYEMCTHKRAFESETLPGLMKVITSGNVIPIDKSRYERDVQDLIDSMLSVAPEKRPTVKRLMGKNVLLPIVYAVFLGAGDESMLYKKIYSRKRQEKENIKPKKKMTNLSTKI